MSCPHPRPRSTSTTSLSRTAPIAAALLLLAAQAPAEPVLQATGDTLDALTVVFHPSAVDASSAGGLARSFVQYRNDLFATGRRFEELFAKAHVKVLADHCAAGIADDLKRRYGKRPAPPACKLVGVEVKGGDATAMLSEGKRKLRAKLRKQGDRWTLRGLERADGESWAPVWNGFPSAAAAALPLPPSVELDRTSAEATVRSLRAAMDRLRRLRERGKLARQKVLPQVVRAFTPATKMSFVKDDEKPRPRFVVGKAADRKGGSRVTVTASEKVPGTDKWSAIGQFAFDLVRTDDGWVITAEKYREKPESAWKPTSAPIGNAFLLAG